MESFIGFGCERIFKRNTDGKRERIPGNKRGFWKSAIDFFES
jgi:hypothetical protein